MMEQMLFNRLPYEMEMLDSEYNDVENLNLADISQLLGETNVDME